MDARFDQSYKCPHKSRGTVTLASGFLVTTLALWFRSIYAAPILDKNPEQIALALIGEWVSIQNAGDFDRYLALYEAKAFHGIKRTHNGNRKTYDFLSWRADRAALFRAGCHVAADSVSVVQPNPLEIPIDVIRVQFTQRFRSKRYADHGVKIIDIRVGKGDAHIIREEMLSSSKGWGDIESRKPKFFDGTHLVAPIRATLMGEQVRDADPPRGRLRLLLIDAQGEGLNIDLGEYLNVPAGVQKPSEPHSKFIFEVQLWWAGSGTDLRVLRDQAGIVVKYREKEEGLPVQDTWLDLARISLKKDAVIYPSE